MNASRAITPPPLSWSAPGVDDALGEAVRVLAGAGHVLVTSHERPDGDAIGSLLAAAEVCEALGAVVTRFHIDPVPTNLQFLPRADEITDQLPGSPVDVTLFVDCGERHRLGAGFPAAGWGAKAVCLDHHKTWDPTAADVFVRDPAAPAAAELVYRLAVTAQAELTPGMATALFCALQTDTGSFRYGSTTWRAMELATALLRTGIPVWPISSAVYESNSPERVRLTARVLQSLAMSDDGRLATLRISERDFAETGATPEMADGMINFARSVRGVEVAAQLTEDGDGVRVSLRSRGALDVSAIAERFGGGGHHNAAGCRLPGTLDDAHAALAAAVQEGSDGAAS